MPKAIGVGREHNQQRAAKFMAGATARLFMNETPPAPVMMELVIRMFKEAFEGAPGPWTYFTDTNPGTGLFSTIGGMTAADASTKGGPSGSTVAGHVQHLASSIRSTTRLLHGEEVALDRKQGWSAPAVDDREWTALKADLRRAYDGLLVAVGRCQRWDEDSLGIAFGGIAHSAYHLGAIRQRTGQQK